MDLIVYTFHLCSVIDSFMRKQCNNNNELNASQQRLLGPIIRILIFTRSDPTNGWGILSFIISNNNNKKLADERYRVQSPVELVDLASRSFPQFWPKFM